MRVIETHRHWHVVEVEGSLAIQEWTGAYKYSLLLQFLRNRGWRIDRRLQYTNSQGWMVTPVVSTTEPLPFVGEGI